MFGIGMAIFSFATLTMLDQICVAVSSKPEEKERISFVWIIFAVVIGAFSEIGLRVIVK